MTDYDVTQAAETISKLRPERIKVVPPSFTRASEVTQARTFVDNFRSSAPYMRMHAGQIMVVHISSSVWSSEDFGSLMDDLGLIKMLGVRLVIVVSIRGQIDEKLAEMGLAVQYSGEFRVTDAAALKAIKEVAGLVRADVEARMCRSLRSPGSQGNNQVNVISSNFFFSSQPVGVRKGVDFGYTGEVRRVDASSMRSRLEAGDVILLTPVGYSPSGESYYVSSESLACECAAQLSARKLLWVTDGHSLVHEETGEQVQGMRLSDAVALMEHYGLGRDDCESDGLPPIDISAAAVPEKASAEVEHRSKFQDSAMARLINHVRFSVKALRRGVSRAHLVSPVSGDLLRELYTSDGAGTLISRDLYDGIRRATERDIVGILGIIEPLVQQGVLVNRSVTDLQQNLEHSYVFVREGEPVACGMLIPYGPDHAEISCLAVKPEYRGRKRGDAMLTFLERLAVGMDITKVFVLSTRTVEFFQERGFEEEPVDSLPQSRRAVYDEARKSKVFMKHLNGSRQLDMEEMYWDQTNRVPR